MSEELIEIISPDAIVTVEMSTGYYNKIQDIINYTISKMTTKETEAAFIEIKKNKVVTPEAEILKTLFILCREFQDSAKKEGFTSMKTQSEIKELVKTEFPEYMEDKENNFDDEFLSDTDNEDPDS